MAVEPYRSTPVFDEISLPAALRAHHATKAGVWGMVRILEGRVRLTYVKPPCKTVLDPATPGLIRPGQPHFVTPLGPMRMRVDFYDQPPDG
ncbi:DUF1971 domain-containing protein [Sphingomonadaceae bacterium jetA1]|jgi:tellurite resistance-related uncharacterized protein|uniref:DUF1971 domain-containing protein n=1 Tax=Facivitalis istanbulensis TaxID=3075838 RepID=UPI00347AFADF